MLRRRRASRHRGDLAPPRARRSFTLVELMVAVGILIVVIVGTAKIFGTVSKVTGLGQAGADVLQEAAAIERQLRADFERLAPEGFFAIRCVAVRNDIHGLSGPLLNPSLPPDAFIRADQLVFFANGVQGTQVFAASSGSNRKQQGIAARIYYGHGFQLPDARPGHDADIDLFPWIEGTVPLVDQSGIGAVPSVVAPIPARQWLLARQAVLLADDGGGTDDYLLNSGGDNSTERIWDAGIRNSRLDIAASQLNDIRSAVVGDGTLPWIPAQRGTIARAVFYPRVERVAPSMKRLDHALTNNVLAGACSSFIIDWTYEDGVGFTPNPNSPSNPYFGVGIDPAAEQPWFGWDPGDERGVVTFTAWVAELSQLTDDGDPIFSQNIDGAPLTSTGQVLQSARADVYEAIFGFNQDTPLNAGGNPDQSLAYTPWPSAIRITMTLHDTDGRLETGREIQFVINLPRRVE